MNETSKIVIKDFLAEHWTEFEKYCGDCGTTAEEVELDIDNS